MSGDCDFGLIGLAVMGENLALNVESRGYKVAVYNRTTEKVDDLISGRAAGKNFVGTHSIEEFVKSVKRPRKLMMLVKAGPAVDALIEQLIPLCEPGDIIIDGGNTHYADTERRTKWVEDAGLLFVGVEPHEPRHHRRVPVVEAVVVGLIHAQHVDDHVHRQPGAEGVDEVDRSGVGERVDEGPGVAVDRRVVRLEPATDELGGHDLAPHNVVVAVHVEHRRPEHHAQGGAVEAVREVGVVGERVDAVLVAGEHPCLRPLVVEDRRLVAHPLPDRIRVGQELLGVQQVGGDLGDGHRSPRCMAPCPFRVVAPARPGLAPCCDVELVPA